MSGVARDVREDVKQRVVSSAAPDDVYRCWAVTVVALFFFKVDCCFYRGRVLFGSLLASGSYDVGNEDAVSVDVILSLGIHRL